MKIIVELIHVLKIMIVLAAQRALKDWIENIEKIYDDKYKEIEKQFKYRLEKLTRIADENHKELQNEIIDLKNNVISNLKKDNEFLSQRVLELEHDLTDMKSESGIGDEKEEREEEIGIGSLGDDGVEDEGEVGDSEEGVGDSFIDGSITKKLIANYAKMDVYRLCVIDDIY